VDAGAYFFSRLTHQTTVVDAAPGRWPPLELASLLNTVVGNRLESAIFLGAKEPVVSRRAQEKSHKAGEEKRLYPLTRSPGTVGLEPL
jgi:hypothetical protein